MKAPLFKRNHLKWGGVALLCLGIGLTFVDFGSSSKDAAPSFTVRQTSKVSGLLTVPTECQGEKVQVVLQGLFQGAHIRVETFADDSGRFQLSAPSGAYLLRAVGGQCLSEQKVQLESTTEHLFSVEMIVKREGAVEVDTPFVGNGRFPASLIESK